MVLPAWPGIEYDEDSGTLRIAGADALTLARSFGTPLLVLNEQAIRDRCRRYRQAFRRLGVEDFDIVYAGKAFLTLAMCQLIAEENLGLDVVSGGELYTALAAGFPPERILFHGNNKSDEELRYALEAGVGCIVIDNDHELVRLQALLAERDRQQAVMLRVVPDVAAETHRAIETGTQDTKFGFDIASGQALAATAAALADPRLRLLGFHCHIGSQIFAAAPFARMVERMYAFLDEVAAIHGYRPEQLDLGGGLGVAYVPGDRPLAIEAYVETLVAAVRAEAGKRSLPAPRILVEPGRSIVAEAGVTLYTVGAIKRIPGVRTYVALDGGMMENPRPALYDAVYTAVVLPRPGSQPPAQRPRETVALVGRACESGDVLIREIELPQPQPGDVVAMFATGAYTYSMASHYNKFPRPAVVMLDGPKARVIVEREKYHDLIRNERPLRPAAKVAASPTKAVNMPQAPAAGDH